MPEFKISADSVHSKPVIVLLGAILLIKGVIQMIITFFPGLNYFPIKLIYNANVGHRDGVFAGILNEKHRHNLMNNINNVNPHLVKQLTV